MITANLS